MKKEIIYTTQYALILSDGVIKEGDYFLTDDGRIEIDALDWKAREWHKKIIAHLPLTDDAPIIEGVPLLPSLPQGEDVEGLAKSQFRKSEYEIQLREEAYIAGYNKAKEKYKYTEEDILEAIQIGFDIGKNFDDDNPNIGLGWLIHQKDNFIESLQQPSRPNHFECEIEVDCNGNNNNGCFMDSSGHNCGCVLPKTITNSQGQEVLVGKYYFEN